MPHEGLPANFALNSSCAEAFPSSPPPPAIIRSEPPRRRNPPSKSEAAATAARRVAAAAVRGKGGSYLAASAMPDRGGNPKAETLRGDEEEVPRLRSGPAGTPPDPESGVPPDIPARPPAERWWRAHKGEGGRENPGGGGGGVRGRAALTMLSPVRVRPVGRQSGERGWQAVSQLREGNGPPQLQEQEREGMCG
jgi:hypothetical protein